MTRTLRSEALPKPPRRRSPVRSLGEDASPREPHTSPGRGTSRPHPVSGVGAKALAGLTIVVVDDEPSNLDYFELALRTYGATVATASNAVDAVRLVRERMPDVVLSDIAMAGHDGYWLVRELRQSEDDQLRRIPVIATTAYGREHSRARTLAAGFTEHLPKPVDPLVLTSTIARLAGRA